MPKEHLSMRKAKEVLRLKWGQGLSNRAIATSFSIGVATVHVASAGFNPHRSNWSGATSPDAWKDRSHMFQFHSGAIKGCSPSPPPSVPPPSVLLFRI
jgi:hypothetical protein